MTLDPAFRSPRKTASTASRSSWRHAGIKSPTLRGRVHSLYPPPETSSLTSLREKWLRRANRLLRKEFWEKPLQRRTGIFIRPQRATHLMGSTMIEEETPKYARIEISPKIRSGTLALAVLLHELIHADQPFKGAAHGASFSKMARPMGFKPPYSCVWKITGLLQTQLVRIRNKLGPYPR